MATIYTTRYPTHYLDFFPLPYPNPTRSQKALPVTACLGLLTCKSKISKSKYFVLQSRVSSMVTMRSSPPSFYQGLTTGEWGRFLTERKTDRLSDRQTETDRQDFIQLWPLGSPISTPYWWDQLSWGWALSSVCLTSKLTIILQHICEIIECQCVTFSSILWN